MEWLLQLTPEQIDAFAALIWKAIAAAGFFGTLIAFRKQIGGTIDRLIRLRLRRGETEILAEIPYRDLPPEAQPDPRQLPEKIEPEAPPEPPRVPDTRDVNELLNAMLDAFINRRIEDAEKAFLRAQESEPDSLRRTRNEATYWAFRYRFAQDTSALQRLQDLAKDEDARSEVLSWLASSHRLARNFEAAEEALQGAIEAAKDELERARYTEVLARCISESGAPSRALQVASKALSALSQPASRAAVYGAVAEIEKTLGNSRMHALALEKVLESMPEDASALFAAAYAESEAAFSLVAVENYDTLLRFDPTNSTASNNLAVESDRLGMPIRTAGLFRRAADADNTLAMANLAYRFMGQGFEKEAEEILRLAATKDKPHANVAHATAALDERREAEKKRWEVIIAQSTQQREFLRAYADAYYVVTTGVDCAGEWLKDGQVRVNFAQSDTTFTATWEEASVKRQLTGALRNRSATIELRKWEKGLFTLRDDAGYWGSPVSGYAYVRPDNQLIAMFLEKADAPTYLHFSRIREQEGKAT